MNKRGRIRRRYRKEEAGWSRSRKKETKERGRER